MDLRETLQDTAASLQVLLLGPGYGESVMVREPGGGWFVVDSFRKKGPPDFGPLSVLELTDTPWAGVVLTHPHKDHAGRLRGVLDSRGSGPVGYAAAVARKPPDLEEFSEDGEEVLRQGAVEDALAAIAFVWHRDPASRWLVAAGDVRHVGGLTVHALHPRADARARDPNRLATPLLVTWESVRLLLGSDLTVPGWREALEAMSSDCIHADYLKIPHHGSSNALDPSLFAVPTGPWVLTPFSSGRPPVPSFTDDGDVAHLLSAHVPVYATALPFATRTQPGKKLRSEVLASVVTSKIDDDLLFLQDSPRLTPEDHWVLVTFDSHIGSQVYCGRGAWTIVG